MKRVITYGTFDLFHLGHYNILKRAKELGDYLIVGVTSESFDIERGKIGIQDSLPQRIENVKKSGFADEIIIEEFQGQKIQDVQKYDVDVLVVGSDWRGKFDYLRAYCDVVYLERTKDISSTQIRENQQFLNIGMILDGISDGGMVSESKYVSGVHVGRVFHEDPIVARQACRNYELDAAFSSTDRFLDGIDAVYIHGAKTKYIRTALEAEKHVLCSFPLFIEEDELHSLIQLAREKHVIFLPCVKPDHIQALNQMFWMIESGTIGNVYHMHCSMTCDLDPDISLTERRAYALYVYYKLFKNKEVVLHTISGQVSGGGVYFNLLAQCEDATACIDIGDGIAVDNALTIYGSGGVIRLTDDWWNTSYFEITLAGTKTKKRYCYNYEGTGLRYILQRILIMLREKQLTPVRFTYEDCIAFNRLYKKIF